VLLLALVGCGSESDPVLEETFDRLYTIQPTAEITIQNRDGAILLYGSNTNEMRIHATKKAYSRTRLKQIAIDVSVQPTSVTINVKLPPKPTWALFDRSGTVDYTIVVPATANISLLRLDAGEVLVDGMRGPTTRARLGEGRIFARNCFSNLDLAMRRGNVIVSYDWWEEGKLSAQADIAQGNVWAYIPGDAAFHLFATATHGKIASDFKSITIAEPSSAAGMKIDTLVNGGGEATMKIRVAEGNIEIVQANP
jgi:hypothetical protein